jgi:dolichol-phosphate mannosyltransferase
LAGVTISRKNRYEFIVDDNSPIREFSPNLAWQLPSAEILEFGPPSTTYAICIPVINEGDRLKKQVAQMMEIKIPDQADILVLDGGSSDGSVDPHFLREQGVRAVLIKTGPGKLSAQLRMGYAYALKQGYQGVVTIDGNNKDGVEAIPYFIRELEAGYDFVQGSRYLPGGQAVNTPWIRHLAVKWIHIPLINLAAGFHYTDTTNGFRGYSRRLLLNPEVQPFREVFSGYELLAYLSVRAPRTGHRVKEIPVIRRYPEQGKIPTKISLFRGNRQLLWLLIKVVLGKFNPNRKNYEGQS